MKKWSHPDAPERTDIIGDFGVGVRYPSGRQIVEATPPSKFDQATEDRYKKYFLVSLSVIAVLVLVLLTLLLT